MTNIQKLVKNLRDLSDKTLAPRGQRELEEVLLAIENEIEFHDDLPIIFSDLSPQDVFVYKKKIAFFERTIYAMYRRLNEALRKVSSTYYYAKKLEGAKEELPETYELSIKTHLEHLSTHPWNKHLSCEKPGHEITEFQVCPAKQVDE